MKKKIELPFLPPDFICYNLFTCANAIIHANTKENHKILMASKDINCFYEKDSPQNKFILSMFDHWCTSQKVMQSQNFNLLKSTYKSLRLNVISVIKRLLDNGSYVFGQCNYSYIDHINKSDDPLFYFVVVGYDDFKREFTIHGLDIKNNFICKHIDYELFANAIFDIDQPNVAFSLWKYNKDVKISLDIPGIVFELEDYINSENRRYQYQVGKVYGIAAIENLWAYISKKIGAFDEKDGTYLTKLLAHKKYMKDRIECLSNHNLIDKRWLHDAEMVHSITLDICEQINNFNVNENPLIREQLDNSFSRMMNIEKNYLPNVLNELKLNV